MGNSHSNRVSPPSASPESRFDVKRKRVSTKFRHTNISYTPCKLLEAQYGPHEPALKENLKGNDQREICNNPSWKSKRSTPTIHKPISVYQTHEEVQMLCVFLREYPSYQQTFMLDTLRRTDYSRLDQSGEVYVDYMGGALYPEKLIRAHSEFLTNSILGNTHSISNSSRLSLKYADEARAAVLSHFRAPAEYTVVFTANASSAIKLVAEAYQFCSGSKLVIGSDSHNSVHGIREFARRMGAQTIYIPSTRHGGVDTMKATEVLLGNCPEGSAPCLYAVTGQSNISNSKTPLSLVKYASSIGYHTLLDAAALAPTSTISLQDSGVDAMAISFYKMFGFPTGVGALVAKKEFLKQLRRPWFAGGTVDMVQVPGEIVTRAHQLHEQFEDGTMNYLSLPAITEGLRFISEYQPLMTVRLTSLLLHLSSALSGLRHDANGGPVIKVLSRLPSTKIEHIGEQSEVGFIIALLFVDPSGHMIPNSFIEYAASIQNISLRTGCMCNTGGAAAMRGMADDMQQLHHGATRADFEDKIGQELGVVRISLGLVTNFHDIWRVIRFATSIGQRKSREQLWSQWIAHLRRGVANDN